MLNKLLDVLAASKVFVKDIYQILFANCCKKTDGDLVYMTLAESKEKVKQIKDGIQLLKKVLKSVEKPIIFFDEYDKWHKEIYKSGDWNKKREE